MKEWSVKGKMSRDVKSIKDAKLMEPYFSIPTYTLKEWNVLNQRTTTKKKKKPQEQRTKIKRTKFLINTKETKKILRNVE